MTSLDHNVWWDAMPSSQNEVVENTHSRPKRSGDVFGHNELTDLALMIFIIRSFWLAHVVVKKTN